MNKSKHTQKKNRSKINSKTSKKTKKFADNKTKKHFKNKLAATETKKKGESKSLQPGASTALPFSNSINSAVNQVSVELDKFVGVIHCSYELVKEECIQNIKHIANFFKKDQDLNIELLRRSKSYQYSIKLPLFQSISWNRPLHGLPHLYIEVSPFNESRPFIRFELKGFSPTKREFYAIGLWLRKIIGSQAERILLANNIKITAVDIAIDFPIDITQIAVNLKHAHRSGVYLDIESSGRVGTFYIGKKKSKLRVVIYDRVANCKAKKLPHSREMETRVEIQLKPNCSLEKLNSELLDGRFLERIEVYDLNEIHALDYIHPHTLCVINMLGLKAAFQSLPKDERRRYRKTFESCRIDIFPNDNVLSETNKRLKKAKALVLGPDEKDYNHDAAKEVRKYFKDKYK
ncbi:replication initiation factor domain-containing protein [Shewanella sp. NIFS-20-20]|uniref:replication initiation factor domain-containing protein n=1 Tax=Shewanella sp. NIFS-20-20 TaxID=2853806 RepID=UPI001C44F38B|nr:replication initiation factor domain-containing protein [Shewanella sp. NIFS-20-20]MBV7317007.1 replication initiation factor domain-containing protein [Shewanella sp. NIFS-20-20]